ncbi:MAG: hypothetical protein KA099_11820 [Alphaproteobacteria bacterium]|nr:hypothetical protein [Alphaproteobacteria bacterium]MBP7759798.1 hypothetical protein [Alphaproteobacteria bacterium]MBP7763120.1 hypothetical protein [Alphaproteobacteria bacterium]MBP7905998.1 hypothetical protein [Alphaproteobacteria bacterium]
MNEILFNAILSMDAYNRGYGRGINLTGTNIGDAQIIFDSTYAFNGADINESFYALAYESASHGTIISYRGTDEHPGDEINGYLVAAGSPYEDQAIMAFGFYNLVSLTTHNNQIIDPRTADNTVTGHSLGGGLAGLVGAIYAQEGYLFDRGCTR